MSAPPSALTSVRETPRSNSNIFGTPLGGGYTPGGFGHAGTGVEAGGEVGYNYQINNIVLGAESDIQYVGDNHSTTYTGAFLPAVGGTVTTTTKYNLNWLGTTRARLGFATLDQNRLLLFVSGGLAYGGGSASLSGAGPAGQSWYGNDSATNVGWTVGGGAEYAFTNNWTVKAEYLYYQLQNTKFSTVANAAATGSGLNYNAKVTPEGSIARVGINYKF